MVFIKQMSDDLLKYILENGIINLDTIQEQMDMRRREKLLERHPYKIFFSESDNNWHTYIPDKTKSHNRRPVKRKSKEDINNIVIEYWQQVEKEEEEAELKAARSASTLKDLFKEWILFKEKHTKSSSYIKRITADWTKYYEPNETFINTPINEFTKVDLDAWAHDMIQTHNMTKKQYYNMSVILRQELDYAVEKEYIEKNVFKDVVVNSKIFRRVKKPDSITQVYTTEEVPLMINEMLRRFYNDPTNTAPLAVLLNFEIGVRMAELVALKHTDITPEGTHIHIQRQRVRTYEYTNDSCTKMRLSGYEVVDYVKSDDGDRYIYLTEVARKIINIILMINKKYGNQFDDYLFVKNDKLLGHDAVQARILRGCDSIGIITKTLHKIRKTYISSLIDSGLNIDEVRRQAGHADERTTYGNYCFNRFSSAETENIIEGALNFKTSSIGLEVIKSNQDSIVVLG